MVQEIIEFMKINEAKEIKISLYLSLIFAIILPYEYASAIFLSNGISARIFKFVDLQ